jgi:capsular polysaccharide transport system permease protein
MRLGIKDRADAQPIGIRFSAALPIIARVLRVPAGQTRRSSEIAELVPETTDVQGASAATAAWLEVDRGRWMARSFVALVIVPAVISSLYLFLLASNQYVSEVEFAVRGSIEKLPGADTLGTAGGLAYMNSNQEVYAIADYIRGPSAAGDVDRAVDLRRVFRAGGADWLTRLRDKASAEDLRHYWNSMVTVTTEPSSGLVSVAVRAFTPQDAVNIATAIRRNSEVLVNRMQQRPRTDLVDKSQEEVRVAREQAAEARAAVTHYRNAQASVDPLDTARSVAGNVAELSRELVGLDVELTTAKATMGPTAPNIANLQAHRDSVKEQIRGLERRIASVDASDHTAAALLVDYDRLEIERTLAEKQVSVAERILDQVRAESNSHQVYIDVIEGPTLPQSALFPERGTILAQIMTILIACWGVISFAAASVGEHTD